MGAPWRGRAPGGDGRSAPGWRARRRRPQDRSDRRARGKVLFSSRRKSNRYPVSGRAKKNTTTKGATRGCPYGGPPTPLRGTAGRPKSRPTKPWRPPTGRAALRPARSSPAKWGVYRWREKGPPRCQHLPPSCLPRLPPPHPPPSTPFTPAPASKVSEHPGAQGSRAVLGDPAGPVVRCVGEVGVLSHEDRPFPIPPASSGPPLSTTRPRPRRKSPQDTPRSPAGAHSRDPPKQSGDGAY